MVPRQSSLLAKKLMKRAGYYSVLAYLSKQIDYSRELVRNMGIYILKPTDNIKLPRLSLIDDVTGVKDAFWFLRSGSLGKESILFALSKNNLELSQFEKILDFGCGCGRLIRHWNNLKKTKIYGCDYNSELIKWSNKHLGHLAEFSTNNIIPPTNYKNNYFDFIYTISVFTHMDEELQQLWLKEIKRILKPGGYVYLTLHGKSRISNLSNKLQKAFREGRLVVVKPSKAGSNSCGAYHPEIYVRKNMIKGMKIVDFIPMGARDAGQDVYLLKKLY